MKLFKLVIALVIFALAGLMFFALPIIGWGIAAIMVIVGIFFLVMSFKQWTLIKNQTNIN